MIYKLIIELVYTYYLFKPESECEGLIPRRQQFFCLNFFLFKQMAVAHSISTLGGGFQLFCAAFDMPVTGVALKVALGYKKIVFWEFQKNNHGHLLDINLGDFGILGK